MADKISFFNNEDIANNIPKVMSQTNYNEEQAKEKLIMFDNDYLKVIRDYIGIPEKKEQKVKSVNQEIFRQIRKSLDSSMKTYRDNNPINMEQLLENLKESDKREKIKMSK